MESKLKAAAMDSVGELPAGYLHLPTTPIKQEPELTDWISGDILPTVDGVYQRDYFRHYKKKTIGYSLFKNGKWHCGVIVSEYWSVNRASQVGKVSSIQNLPWRGLAKKTEVQSDAWNDAGTKPDHPCLCETISKGISSISFQYWNGEFWGFACAWKDQAIQHNRYKETSFDVIKWREVQP